MGDDRDAAPEGAVRLIESISDTERAALDAVREFVDTVDRAVPDLGDGGPRQQIIDSAFRMAEQLVGASNQFATSIVTTTQRALGATPPAPTPPEEWLG